MNRHERYNRSPKGRARYERYRLKDNGANERHRKLSFTVKRRADRIQQIEELLT
jgi:hypothetical protein